MAVFRILCSVFNVCNRVKRGRFSALETSFSDSQQSIDSEPKVTETNPVLS